MAFHLNNIYNNWNEVESAIFTHTCHTCLIWKIKNKKCKLQNQVSEHTCMRIKSRKSNYYKLIKFKSIILNRKLIEKKKSKRCCNLISSMQGMCRTCCTFHAASLSLICHMPLSILKYKTPKHVLPMCSFLSPRPSQTRLCWPISPSHAPFREATLPTLLLPSFPSFYPFAPPATKPLLFCPAIFCGSYLKN